MNYKAIKSYVHDTLLGEDPITGRRVSHTEQMDILIEEVCNKSEGVFLWTRLAVQDFKSGLRAQNSVDIPEKRLALLYRSLDGLFNRLLLKIHQAYKTNAANLLRVILLWTQTGGLALETIPSIGQVAFALDPSLKNSFNDALHSRTLKSNSLESMHKCFEAVEASVPELSAELLQTRS